MKRLFIALVVLSVLCVAGCPVKHRGPSGGNEPRVAQNPNDPFVSGGGYIEPARGGSSQNRQDRIENSAPEPVDPFDRFFNNMGPEFSNISAQPTYTEAPSRPQPRSQPAVQPRTTVQPSNRPRQPIDYSPTRPSVPYSGNSPGLMSMTETGPKYVSLTYPSDEYGIIKLDKIIPGEVNLDQSFKYSIVIKNLTNTTLNSIVLTESLANSFVFETASPTPQQIPGQLVWRFESLAPKSTEQIDIFGRPEDVAGLKHSTTLTYALVTTSNIKVVKPELQLIRRVPSETLLCDPFPIEYIVKNVGSGSAKEVRIFENLQSGLQTTDGSAEISFNVGTLRAGEERTFAAEIRAQRSAVYANTATATSISNTGAKSAATATTVRQPALVITKNGAERQYLGRPLTYEITVINRGDGIAKNTILEDIIPPDVTEVEASAGADVSGTRLTWNLGAIAPNSKKSVRVSYKPTKVGTFVSESTVNAHCTETIIDSSRTEVVGIPIVSLDVVDLEDPVEVGDNITYIITATNDGSADDHNLRVTCQLEDKIQYISATGASTATVMGHKITFSQLRTLPARTKQTWRVLAKAVSPGQVRFKVTMTSDELNRPVEETEASYLYE